MNTLELIKKIDADRKAARERFNSNPKFKESFTHEQHKPNDFKDKTFLFIRATDTDNGSRPLAPGTVFWNSPDIELYNNLGVLIATNQLVINQNFTVSVLVHNEGDMTCNSCVVELFICNPTIGFDRASATSLGIQNISIQGHKTGTAKFSFTPGPSNLGHQCLFARAYSYVTADMPDSAGQFNTFTDRHIGQQNLSIISQGTPFEFLVFHAADVNMQNLTLKVVQNKDTLKNHRLMEVAKLTKTTKNIRVDQFNFKKNIFQDPKVVTPPNQPEVIKPAGRFTIFKPVANLFNTIARRNVVSPAIKNIEPTHFEVIKPAGNNTWNDNFTKGLTKVSVDIPNLSLRKNQATQLEIEMINPQTGLVIGGLTVIVKG